MREALYRYWGGEEPNDFEAADQFILRSFGMFKSRAASRSYRGANFSAPVELRSIFRDI